MQALKEEEAEKKLKKKAKLQDGALSVYASISRAISQISLEQLEQAAGRGEWAASEWGKGQGRVHEVAATCRPPTFFPGLREPRASSV